MSGTLNKVCIIGRLGKDPEIRTTQAGRPIANMSLATEEKWTDKQTGERKSRTEWHRVVCFNEHLAKIITDWVRKGSLIYIEGQLATRKWTDQSGQERFTTEVVLPRFGGMLTLLSDGGSRQGSTAAAGSAPGKSQADLDDDIPF